MTCRGTYCARAREFARKATQARLAVLVVGAKAYSRVGVFCFDPSDTIPSGRSMLAMSVLEALQQATLWQIEQSRAKYLT